MSTTGIKRAHVLSSIEQMVRVSLGLDPSTTLIDQVVAVARELPENANAINPPYAEYLAGRFLKGLDVCNELYALSIGYELKSEISKKKAHGEAFIIRSKTKGLKTAKEMEAYANTDDIYVEAAEKHAEAKMLRVLVENIRSDFEKAHYLMRKIAEKDVNTDYTKQTLPAGSNSSDSDEASEDVDTAGWASSVNDTVSNTNTTMKRQPW